jgi:hypothetical protein
MRKVYVDVKVRIILNAEEGLEITDILNDMEYDLKSNTTGAEVIDTEMSDWEVTDSK